MAQNNLYMNDPNLTNQNGTTPNNTNPDNSGTGNPALYMPAASNAGSINNPYTTQNPYSGKVKEEDSAFTKSMKKHFPFFGIGSFLYAVFYTFCLYKNASGITYPFFVAGTLCYFFFSMQKLGVPYKKDSIFCIVSIILLGISNCLTNSPQLLFMNKCGIFVLSFVLMIHTIYQNKNWNFPKYFIAFCQMTGLFFVNMYRPISDMVSYFDEQKQDKNKKKSYFLPVLIGITITIPVFVFMTLLLASADAVFSNILSDLFASFNFSTIFEILILSVIVLFCSYSVYATLCMKNVKEEVNDYRLFDPIIAIIVTAALSALYLIFSVIQILYLFIGNMQLPEGYSYSGYAREGFFQLLAVCILNLMIVLICLYLFRENKALKAILTIISGCTFIMILSSALRMLMYINRYNLTFLRIFVLWSLAVIFLLMAGVTIFIHKNRFPLFTYSMVIVTVFYIGLSFAHPDYWIASYNLNPAHMGYLDEYDVSDSRKYLRSLSADAAPVLLNQEKNPYLTTAPAALAYTDETSESLDNMAGYSREESSYTDEISWLQKYYKQIKKLSQDMHIRNFNFSICRARKYL